MRKSFTFYPHDAPGAGSDTAALILLGQGGSLDVSLSCHSALLCLSGTERA